MAGRTDDTSKDAVVILPGIMGSELIDSSSGEQLWGLSDPRWYVSAWTSGRSLAGLRVSDAERTGSTRRVTATRLLRAPAFAPFLRGAEPYRELVAGVSGVMADPQAVLEFPYDWRLSVARIARTFGDTAIDHLRRWQRHPAGTRDARLIIVAHSMGGLVADYFCNVLGGSEYVRRIVTLGTPFYGAVKAAQILSAGIGAPVPLPHSRLREVAITMPGVYDLLPSYRCVDDGNSARRLSPADLEGVGADGDLIRDALETHELLATKSGGTPVDAIVGVGQPTVQSLVIRDGVPDACHYTCETSEDGGLVRIDRLGDSTVYRDSASRGEPTPAYLPQTHAVLAKSHEAIAHVRSVITRRQLGPPLAVRTDELPGLQSPDVVGAGEALYIVLRNLEPGQVSCVVRDITSGEIEDVLALGTHELGASGLTTLAKPGVYRIEVEGHGYSALEQLVMATPPNTNGE